MISVVFLKSPVTRSFLTVSRTQAFLSTRRFESTTATNTGTPATDKHEDSQTNSSNTVKSSDFYDIVICGGGMVGSAMAYALGRDEIFRNLKIALIESSPKSGKYESPAFHSNRTCALSKTTTDFFKSLGNFEFIEKHRYGNVKHMHVWDGSSDAHITFENDDESNLAIIAENNLIQASLTKDLDQFPNLTVLYEKQLKEFKVQDSGSVDIVLKNDSKLTTSLLIGSDGPNSQIRQGAGFNVTKWEYDQVAIVATLKLKDAGVNDTAWQRFLSSGPIALLPLNDEYSSLVWSIKKSLAKDVLSLSDEELVAKINHAFIGEEFKNEIASNIEDNLQKLMDFIKETKLLPIDQVDEIRQLPPRIESCVPKSRGSYPLGFLHANNYAKNRIALIGDAVHRVHPLAGQGVNLGFGDVICLTEALRENVANGAEIGATMYLEQYESRRQREAFIKAAGIDILNKLYTDYDYPFKTPLVALRSIGLTVVNRTGPFKSLFKSMAMK